MNVGFDYISDDSLRFFCSSVYGRPEESVLISKDVAGVDTCPDREIFAQAGLAELLVSF